MLGGSLWRKKNDVWSSENGSDWIEVTASADWTARYHHTSIVFDNKIWVLGGCCTQNDVWSSIDGTSWTEVTASADWTARYQHTSIAFDNKIWVLGGTGGGRKNDVWSSENGSDWIQATDAAGWTARDRHTSNVFDNKMWVLGGDDGSRKNDVWSSVDGNSWTEVTASAGWTARSVYTSTVFDNKIWVLGGYGGSWKNDVWSSGINNNSFDNALSLHSGSKSLSSHSAILTAEESDYYQIYLTEGTWTFSTQSGINTVCELYNSSQNPYLIQSDNDGTGDNCSITYNITTAGDYYIQVFGYSNTTGNYTLKIDPPAPDLVVSSFTANPTFINPHSTINLSATVTNSGTGSVAGTTLRYYRSTDSTIDTADIEIGIADSIDSLSVNSSESETATITWHNAGTMYYGACVMAVAGETTTDNNCSSGAAVSIIGSDWTEVTASAGWSARWSHTSIAFDNRIWVLGGYDGGFKNDVWSSVDGTNWTEVTASADWTARREHTSIAFDNKMWVLGGYDGSRKNDVWSSVDGSSWTEVKPNDNNGWTARTRHTSVVFDNKMWVLGGYDGSRKNDVWYSVDGTNWTGVTASADWTARGSHTSTVFDNKIWVLGGVNFSQRNDVWSSSNGINWIQATDDAGWNLTGWSYHTSIAFDNKIWVLGNVYHTNDVWSSENGTSWTQATDDAGWTGRYDHTSVAFDNKIWVLGGYDGSWKNDVWSSGINNNSFDNALSLDSGSKSLSSHSAILTAGESDYYQIYLTEGTWTFSTQSGINTVCELYDSSQNRITINDSGTGNNCSITYNITTAGNYYILVKGISNSTAGNYTLKIDPPAPDLVVSSFTANPTFINPHSTINLSATVTNSGTGSVAGTTLRYYRSTDSTIDTADIEIGIADSITALSANVSESETATITGHNAGTMYYGVCVVAVAGETNISNNCSSGAAVSIIGSDWTEVTASAGWTARSALTSIVFDNKIWVLGGYSITNSYNDVWSSVDGTSWVQVKLNDNNGWRARYHHTSIAFDNKIWVLGGANINRYNDVWSSVDGSSWVQVKPNDNNGWTARESHTSVVFDNKMWVLGGDGPRKNDVWYSSNGTNWTGVTASADWAARESHASTVFDNKIWVLGGVDFSHRNDVWSSSNGINWIQATDDAGWNLTGRSYHTSIAFDNKIWVLGSVYRTNDVWSSENGTSWTQATDDAGWTGRYDHTSVAFDNKIWVLGGYDGSWKNDVWSSGINNNSFDNALSLDSGSKSLSSHSAILTAGESDYYRVHLTAGIWTFSTQSEIDTVCELYNSPQNPYLIQSDNDGTLNNCSITYTINTTGDYYIQVFGYSNTTGNYTLDFSKAP